MQHQFYSKRHILTNAKKYKTNIEMDTYSVIKLDSYVTMKETIIVSTHHKRPH